MNVTAHHVESHFNKSANSVIPGYWTPDVDSYDGAVVFPCGTKAAAIELGERMIANGEAE